MENSKLYERINGIEKLLSSLIALIGGFEATVEEFSSKRGRESLIYKDPQRHLNTKEMATRLGMSQKGLYDWLEKYGVPIVKKGTHTQVVQRDFLDAQTRFLLDNKQSPWTTSQPNPKQEQRSAF